MSVHHLFQNNYQWDGVSKEGFDNILLTCDTNRLAHLSKKDIAQYQSIRSGDGILYTFDVRWIPMDVAYSNRWETYITNYFIVPMKVHWNSVFNSVIMTILCIAGGSFFLKRHLQQTKKQMNCGDSSVAISTARLQWRRCYSQFWWGLGFSLDLHSL